MVRYVNMKGRVVNGIRVIEEAYKRDKKQYWKCVCHCGKVFYTYTSALNGRKPIKSCGCFRRTPKTQTKRTIKKWKDVETHGFKVSDKYMDYDIYKSNNIEVICDTCSHKFFRNSSYMYRNGVSCPECNNKVMSYPERLFKSLLLYLEIDHEQEYIDERLPHRRFDFKIEDTYYEINGVQHYEENKFYWISKEEFEKIVDSNDNK